MWQLFLEQVAATSTAEWVAVVAAILYLLLAIRENIACWFFAAISSGTYVVLFIDAKLYMESLLNAYYLLMAAYGFWVWTHGRDATDKRRVVRWSLNIHIIAVVVILGLSAISGYALSSWTDAALPFFDSLTTFGAFWATLLVARKVFENWYYWLIIDLGSIGLYLSRDLYLTSILFLVYLAMIPFGIAAWKRSMEQRVHVTG
ncbi:MAG: nicotinamide riboside transporter PnuC [Pseudomonadota bacterium]